LIPIMILLCISLVRWLNQDFGHLVQPKELSLKSQDLNSNNEPT